MSRDTTKKGGVNREYGKAIIQKWTFILIHLMIILFCIWIVYFDGLVHLGEIFKKDWNLLDPNRAKLLLACALLYWLRHIVTLFYLLERKLAWSEVIELVFFMAFFEIGLLLLGGGAFREYIIQFGWLDIVASILLVFGAFLNSFSEIQRKLWKKDTSNKGHCYSKGLFNYSMHINYFGDTIMFTGWCLFTYNFWSLGLPFLMAIMFIFFHIPGLDVHLYERYGAEFKAYSERTKRFIPFLY